jgi:hypothetical protein
MTCGARFPINALEFLNHKSQDAVCIAFRCIGLLFAPPCWLCWLTSWPGRLRVVHFQHWCLDCIVEAFVCFESQSLISCSILGRIIVIFQRGVGKAG